MSDAAAPLIPRDGSLVFSDGAGTPLTCTLAYTDGDVKIDGITQGNWETQV